MRLHTIDDLLTDNPMSEEPDVDKNKESVAKVKTHFAKRCFKRSPHSESVLVQKPTGIQLKTGAVFCLPAKSSHSSRIIIPNKRFLEDDYHKVEVSPKKPKVEHLSADVKKTSILAVPSTYRCSLGTRKRLKFESGNSISDVPREPVIGAEDKPQTGTGDKPHIGVEDSQCKLGQTERQTSDVDNQDAKSDGNKNDKPESVTAKEEPVTCKSVTENSENVNVTSVSSPAVVAGSILQKPKLCLDQTAVDRSTLAFAKSLRSQMAKETQSDSSNHGHVTCSSSATESVITSELHSVISSSQMSNSMPSRTCNSWNSRTGKSSYINCKI